MRNVTKKAMASVLSAALLVGSLLLPGIIRVRAADDAPRFVSEITLTDSDPNTTNTLDKYDLLENPSAGLVLAEGDTYVFDMDIKTGSWNNAGKAWAFGFDLLGNPEAFEGRELRLSGIELNNEMVLYWNAAKPWEQGVVSLESGDGKILVWGGGDYHYRFTVNAYENIQLRFWYGNTAQGYSNKEPSYVGTVAWDDIYGLNTLKPDDGKLFYPNMAFFDQNGKITNITVRHSGNKGSTVDTVKQITLEDTDKDTDGTLAKYDLLADPTNGLTMDDGDIYTFDMDILANRYNDNQGGTAKPFGFDLLGNPTKSDNGAEIKLAGVEFANKNALYWIANGAWNVFMDKSQPFTIWGGGNYHYRFTVKAYESLRVEFCYSEGYNAEKKGFDATVAWDQVYGLSNCMAGDGTVFYPNMAFLDQDGAITNIQCTYTRVVKPPVIGAKDVDLAADRELPGSFAGSEDTLLDLGLIEPTMTKSTWNYSATFRYDQFGGEYSGLNAIFAEGTYAGQRQNLMIAAKAHQQNGQVVDTQLVLRTGADGTVLHEATLPTVFTTGTEYTLTVRARVGKVSFWINDELLLESFDLTAAEVTDLMPKFGFNADGTSGTISAIHVWGNIACVIPAPTRPETAANLLQDCEEIASFTPTFRKNYYDNSKIQVQGDTWYYSGSYIYEGMPAYGGITPIFGEGTYTKPAGQNTAAVTGTRELSVTARSGGFAAGARQTQSVIWADEEAIKVDSVSGLSLELGKKYTWTVRMTNGLLSFWLNNVLVFDDVDLASYGITNIRPKFGFLPDGSSGTLSDVQVWDTATTEYKPVYTEKDINNAVLSDVKLSAAAGRLLYEGISYTDNGGYNYAADVTGKDTRLIAAKAGGDTVEAYYDGAAAYLVRHSGSGDTVIAKAAATVDVSAGRRYIVRYDVGKVSFWVNDVLVLSRVAVDGSVPAAGAVTTAAAGRLSNIRLWGDVSQIGGTVYQPFEDIAAYRGEQKTYPAANGYVFGGWYQTADEAKPLTTDTTDGAAYAKLVPETVLSVKTTVLKDAAYTADKTDLRFVTTVDSLRYRRVGITLSSDGKARTFTSRDVYKSIKTGKEENAWASPKNAFCSDSLYFFTVKVNGIDRFDAVWTATPCWTTLDGTEVTGVPTEIAVNDKFGKRVAQEQLGLNGSTLLQVADDKTNTMAYVIRTNDGKTVVIDGGSKDDAAYLVWLLKTRYGVSSVDAWYVTHEDGNHTGALESILDDGSLTIGKIYYNFQAGSTGSLKTKLAAAANAEEIGRVTHTYGAVTIRAVNDHKDYAQTANSADKATTVLLAEFGGSQNTGVLFLGDLTKETEAYVLKQAQDAGIDMTGKVVQLDNHGSISCSKAFYEQLQPKVCLWPCVRSTWDNSGDLRSFLTAHGATAQYSAVSQNIEFH